MRLTSDATVYDYSTGEPLPGRAEERLVGASADEETGTGAVYAYLDREGVWTYLAADEVETARREWGVEPRIVYLEE